MHKEQLNAKISSIKVSIETIVYNIYLLKAVFRLSDMPDWLKRMDWLEAGIIEFKRNVDRLVEDMKKGGLM